MTAVPSAHAESCWRNVMCTHTAPCVSRVHQVVLLDGCGVLHYEVRAAVLLSLHWQPLTQLIQLVMSSYCVLQPSRALSSAIALLVMAVLFHGDNARGFCADATLVVVHPGIRCCLPAWCGVGRTHNWCCKGRPSEQHPQQQLL